MDSNYAGMKKDFALDKSSEHSHILQLEKRKIKSSFSRLLAYVSELPRLITVGSAAYFGRLSSNKKYHQQSVVIGSIFLCIATLSFIALVTYQYFTIRKQEFISPNHATGCDIVLRPNSLTSRFDENGHWDTFGNFDSNTDIFQVQFFNVSVNMSTYQQTIKSLQILVSDGGSHLASYSMSTLYVALATYEFYLPSNILDKLLPDVPYLGSSNSKVSLRSLALPSIMFDGPFFLSNITLVDSNAQHTMRCAHLQPTIIGEQGRVSITYQNQFHSVDQSSLYQSEGCNDILNVDTHFVDRPAWSNQISKTKYGNLPTLYINATEQVGQSTANNKEKVVLEVKTAGFSQDIVFMVDLTAMIVAIGVNLGILNATQLSRRSSNGFFVLNGAQPYFYERYPEMDDIFCVPFDISTYTHKPSLQYTPKLMCYVAILTKGGVGVFGLPVVISHGRKANTLFSDRILCTCPIPPGYEESCNEPNFSFMIVSMKDILSNADSDAKLLQEYISRLPIPANWSTPYISFMNAAFDASTLNGQVGDYNNPADVVKFQTELDNALDFCDKKCNIIVMQFEGLAAGVTPNSRTLDGTVCTANAFPSPAAWANLAAVPPVPLEESYYKCTYTRNQAFLQALGIAAGNMQIVLALMTFALFPLTVYLMESCGYIKPDTSFGSEYDDEDKKLALEELALHLLRVRDGDKRGITPDGELERLSLDLLKTARSTARLRKGSVDGVVADADPNRPSVMRPSASVFLDLGSRNSHANMKTSDKINNPVHTNPVSPWSSNSASKTKETEMLNVLHKT